MGGIILFYFIGENIQGQISYEKWMATETALASAPITALEPTKAPGVNSQPTKAPEVTEEMLMATEPPPDCTQQGQTWLSPNIDMELVCIPAGEFLMGSNRDVDIKAADDELPQRTVYLDAYWIDRTEVSNVQYSLCMSWGGCTPPHNFGSYERENYFWDNQYANYPVVYIDWNQAKTYCEWVMERLPTEAEWEKAARGEDGRTYPWGNASPAADLLNFADSNTSFDWTDKTVNDGYMDTSPRGNYPDGASPYSVLDMAGNVFEWVADWYGVDYYSIAPDQNPSGPESGQARVLRGGSWGDDQSNVRSTVRGWRLPDDPDNFIGFRCALSDTP